MFLCRSSLSRATSLACLQVTCRDSNNSSYDDEFTPPPVRLLQRCGIEVIEHQVDDHTCDRDVEPHGESPARDATVTRELTARSPNERHYHEGHDCCRQDRVG